MLHDPLADAMTAIRNADKAGKKECVIGHATNVTKEVLRIFQKAGYIGPFEYIEDGRGGKFRVELLGKINECGVIRPRFSVKKEDWEKWEKRYLPAVGIGLLAVSTPKGILSHREIRGKAGGSLVAYIY